MARPPSELERCATFGCLLWRGRRDKDGYGRTSDGRLAHRVAYEQAFGPIPEGRTVEHGCRRRNCVEPLHFEAYTRSEQERAKRFGWTCRRTKCRMGHDMEHAAITPELGRVCRTCARALIAKEAA